MDPNLILDIISEEQAVHLFYSIVAAGFVFWITAMVHNYVKSLIALRKVVGSARIAKNNVLRFPTATGSIDGRILNIERDRVEIEFPEYIKTIPTKVFADMEWNVVKNKKIDMMSDDCCHNVLIENITNSEVNNAKN